MPILSTPWLPDAHPATSRRPGGVTAAAPWGVSPRLPGLGSPGRSKCCRRRLAVEHPDQRLGCDAALVEAGLVGQEAVGVRVHQLHDARTARRGTRRRPWRTGRPTRRGRPGRTRQRSSLSSRPTSSTPMGISTPPRSWSRTRPMRPRALTGLMPNTTSSGNADIGRQPDRVGVAGPGRVAGQVGRHRLDGEAVRLDHELDLLGVRDVEVGELHGADRIQRGGGTVTAGPCTGSCSPRAGSASTSW